MKVSYTEVATLRAGIPYTYGSGSNWYVLLRTGDVLHLNYLDGIETMSTQTAEWHRRSVHAQHGFRYAKSMEIL